MTIETLRDTANKRFASGIRGRYAPSPTGALHLGNLRTALLAWLQTRLNQGQLILRIEDLDQARTRPGSAEQLIDDLRWLGLDWDEGPEINASTGPFYQSDRNQFYEIAFEYLRSRGKIYPCYCSRKDIILAASAPHKDTASTNKTTIYPGTCRNNTAYNETIKNGRAPAWRYRVPERTISFSDEIMGCVCQALHKEAGDFVIRRSDKIFAYHLAVVVDDALMGISDVVRGADLLDSTPIQIELYEALGFKIPRFWHVPLMKDNAGNRLSKREGADSVTLMHDQGHTADSIIGILAATLGFVPANCRLSAQELLEELTIDTFRDKISRAVQQEYTPAS